MDAYIKNLIDDFVVKSLEAKAVSKEAKELKETLLKALIKDGLLQNDEGYFTGDNHSIKASHKKKKNWKTEELEALFGGSLPDYVHRKLSIPETLYNELSADELKALQGCFDEEDTVTIRILS